MGSYFPNHPHLLDTKPVPESQRLFDLAKGVTPFSSDRGQAWVSFNLGENGEIVWPARSPRFRDWLIHRFQEEHGKLPAYCAVAATLAPCQIQRPPNPPHPPASSPSVHYFPSPPATTGSGSRPGSLPPPSANPSSTTAEPPNQPATHTPRP